MKTKISDVSLRLLTEDMREATTELANHTDLSATSELDCARIGEQVREWIALNNSSETTRYTYAIFFEGKIVGCCSLKWRSDSPPGQVELSYWVGKDFQGRGIGKSAAANLVELAFSVYKARSISAHYLKNSNPASGKILGHLGFAPDPSRDDRPAQMPYDTSDAWTFRILRRRKWSRWFLFTIANLTILATVVALLSYIVPYALGILWIDAVEALRFTMYSLALVSACGLLWLKNWARLLMIGVVSIQLLSISSSFYFMRHLGIDTFGYVLIACILLFYTALIATLIAARNATLRPRQPASRFWRVAGLAAAGFGTFAFSISFLDTNSTRLADLPEVKSDATVQLTQYKQWKLEKIPTSTLLGGNIHTPAKNLGTLSVTPENGMFKIAGIPELNSFDVRLDPTRNALLVGDVLFIGEPFDIKRFLWRDLPAKGISFSNEGSPVSGKIIIGTISDGTTYILLNLEMYFRAVEALYKATPPEAKLTAPESEPYRPLFSKPQSGILAPQKAHKA